MDVEVTDGIFVNGRGQKLKTYAYRPKELRCVLFFHHGFGEYSARADLPKVFKHWAKAGIAVHTYDAHGHGHSEPKAEEDRFLIWDFNHIVDDYIGFTKSVKTDYDAGLPMFIGGHSMGSLASIHVALRDQTAWSGIVLGTATVDVEWNWMLRLQASIGSVLAMLIPRACIVPTPPADVNATPALEEKIEADPLLATGNVRARTANELLRAFSHVQQFGHLLWLPIYAHHGTADPLANIQAVRSLLGRCASPDITMYEVEGGAHELFVGIEREQVTAQILGWIDRQLTQDTDSEVSETFTARSLVSLAGDPPEWLTAYSSPVSSVYGGSPVGNSPVGTPRCGQPLCSVFNDDSSLSQEQPA